MCARMTAAALWARAALTCAWRILNHTSIGSVDAVSKGCVEVRADSIGRYRGPSVDDLEQDLADMEGLDFGGLKFTDIRQHVLFQLLQDMAGTALAFRLHIVRVGDTQGLYGPRLAVTQIVSCESGVLTRAQG